MTQIIPLPCGGLQPGGLAVVAVALETCPAVGGLHLGHILPNVKDVNV
ncbi:MAG TPA: hypothetical protein VKI99_16540 [Candidatus Dormibacteraeota bacterium]|nr:hypothetical protein [Candidatus Dormibacteraeota bacterium]